MVCKEIFLGFFTLFILGGGLLRAMEQEQPSDPTKILFQAATDGDVEKFTQAVQAGADVNATDTEGRQAIHLAAMGGHISLLNDLVSRGIYVNTVDQFGSLPIHYAAENGHVAAVEWLIEHGADSNALGGLFNQTPVRVATPEVAQWLVEHGASIDLSDTEMQASLEAAYSDPLLRAIVFKDSAKAINLLTDYLGQAEKDPALVRRLLLMAAARGESSVIEFMLSNLENFIDEESLQKAFLMAVLGNSLPTVRFIFRFVYRRQEINGGWSTTLNRALFYAIYRHNQPMLAYLLNRDFALGLHLDLDAVGNYVTRLLRSGRLQNRERGEYIGLRNALIHATQTRRVETSIEKSLEHEEPPTQFAALIRQLPIEILMLILSFLPQGGTAK